MSCSTSTNRYPANLDFEKELDAVLRSSKTLAYKSSATDEDKVISHKTFLTFIDQAVAKNAEELIFNSAIHVQVKSYLSLAQPFIPALQRSIKPMKKLN